MAGSVRSWVEHARTAPWLAFLALILSLAAASASAQSGVVLATDDFERPDELPLSTAGSWPEAIVGGGTVNLVGHRIVGANGDAVRFWQGPEVFDDARQYARAQVVDASGQVGLVVLGGTGQALIGAWSPGGTVTLYWYSQGINRGNLVVAPSTLQAGDEIEVALLDGTVYAKVNGVVVASAANTTTLASGRPGFETFLAGGSLDDWEAGTPQPYTIRGTVSDGVGGVAGVLVRASGLFGATAVTDATGAYTLTGVPGGMTSIVLTALAAGYDLSPPSRTVAGPVAADVTGEDFTATASGSAVVANDGFDRPPELPLVVGGVWEKAIAGGTRSAQLVDGRVVGVEGDAVYAWQGPGSFDPARQYARAQVVDASGQVGLVVLGGTGQALIGAWSPGGTVTLYWYSQGINRGNLVVAPSTLQAGDEIEVALLDGTVYAKVNGVVVASAANTTTLASGRPGFETFLAGGSLDDWEAGTPQPYTIRGTVSDGVGGVAGVLVRASGLFGATAVTDATGAYTLTGVPGGMTSIVLTALAAGYDLSPPSRTVAGPVAADVTGEDFTATASGSAVVANDGFDRPPELPLVVGGAWEKAIAGGTRSAQLVDGRVVGVEGDAVYAWQGPGSFDPARQYARAQVEDASGQVGLVVLGGTGQALIGAWSPGGTVTLYWYSQGINRGNLVVAPSTLQAGDEIEVALLDGTVYAKVNGVVVASAANTTTLASGRPGFETFLAGGSLDDWEAGTPQPYTIRGTVSDGVGGVAGVLVRASGLFGATAVTDATGAYTLTGVPGGMTSIVLTALAAGYDLSPPSRTVAGPVAADVTGEDFTATASSSTVAAADDFNRPAELPFVVGGNWQRAISNGARAQLVGERVVGAVGDAVYAWQGPGSFDPARQYARAQVEDASGQVGLVVLGGTGQALIGAWSPGGTVTLYWYSQNANRGDLVVAPSTLQAGDEIEVELLDGTLYAKVNGAVVASAANTTTLASGRPGFETFLAGGSLDDWEAGAPNEACDDGLDNDGDGLADLLDPGCADALDSSERNPAVACDDGLDNDGDALIDLSDPDCTDPADTSESDVVGAACDDGLDNDGDGRVDLLDPGCANAADPSEQNAAVACDDGLDNDGDTLIDLADPGCTDPADATESEIVAAACSDGLDNDGDGRVDLLDPGCADAADVSERNPAVACDDGADNDGDLLIDLADPGCAGPADTSEQDAALACDDGVDNDGDGLVDLLDPGCASETDESEQNAAVACDDGADNDGDALIDLADPGCADPGDGSEQSGALSCDDGLDNDGDGLVDLLDPGCANAGDASELNEAVACDDGVDNDGDTLIDWPDDPDCASATDASEAPAPPAVPSLPLSGLLVLVAALVGTAARAAGRLGRARRAGRALPGA